MKLTIVPSSGLGDAVIMILASHHLQKAGFDVTTVTRHRFGKWTEGLKFADEIPETNAIFLQHGNDSRSQLIKRSQTPVYTFYGAYQESKHGPWHPGYDYAADLNETMYQNVRRALRTLFSITANEETGFTPPKQLIFRKNKKQVVIHPLSGSPQRNWPLAKFQKVADWLSLHGFEPVFLPQCPSLEALASFLYESGSFLGNDSGPGHLASTLLLPNCIIGREKRHMRHWRPGWGEIIVPPRWVPNIKGLRIREKYWKTFITSRSVINTLKNSILKN
ncbi:MAG: hypothetical protein A2796_04395 [Chlamydiae bacterium RIFCSPHIGHO2_01_FULL_44_39]|nr:MAG: hypothetical protein A2796_04395 [Chlamydiae bacterium RIFCSPHIGHO2_01_FULL_44_39]OGN66270.1 MAG: hypothetical protein A2978_00030 [Chlamydiae bacterium RIFCSPLOWO2_01_FULL_44_52]OGN68918.1 MAG: hypothetical protein A3I67_04010 [Chlamydiae bacterium RIFCSPLOWO2_02_FULL_45_22]